MLSGIQEMFFFYLSLLSVSLHFLEVIFLILGVNFLVVFLYCLCLSDRWI